VTSLVVAVNKAFATKVPAGAHEGGVVPFGAILQAFPCKIALPDLAFLQKKFVDGGSVFGDCSPLTLSDFLFFPPFCFPSSPGGMTVVAVDGFLGGGSIKLGGRVTLAELFMTISKTSSKQQGGH
jgi:hypothetical protein